MLIATEEVLTCSRNIAVALFGDYEDEKGKPGLLVKLNKNSKEEWKRAIRPHFDEIESQSVVQDKNGNFYF